MLDFVKITTKLSKGYTEVYPKFWVRKSSDLMIRGNDFYAIWDEDEKTWSTDPDKAVSMIDHELAEYAKELKKTSDDPIRVLYLVDGDTGMIDKWKKFVTKQMYNNFHALDETLIFSNTPVSKENYSSKSLPYPLKACSIPAYDELMNVLYSQEERMKIEWVIGAIVSGDSKNIQKFLVLYGPAGTGKSTVINIIQKLFAGYFSAFDSKALGSATDVFALEAFKNNPLIGIQHDGDLSRIEDNTRINSIVSHEVLRVNEKFKSTYEQRFNTFLIMGTNKPVKITDAKSGILRRLIDVSPTGQKIQFKKYTKLMSDIDFELGGIAQHCLDVYEGNKHMYDTYIPLNMMSASNDFYNFVLEEYEIFKQHNRTTLGEAWAAYDIYCQKARVPYPMSKRVFKEELKNYFEECDDKGYTKSGIVYLGFLYKKFENDKPEVKVKEPETDTWIELRDIPSLLDENLKDCPAQYTTKDGNPKCKWINCKTTLKDISSKELHFVKVPENHIVIDFDIPVNGEKSLEANLAAASKWPKTYAELSKSGKGIHLHYIYTGDPSKLAILYKEHIEVKVFTGNASLRRKLTLCNDIPVASISSRLPLKKEGGKVSADRKEIKDQEELVAKIQKAIDRGYSNVPSTASGIALIKTFLDQAYESGIPYSIPNTMINDIWDMAYHSTNQKENCVKMVAQMKFESKIEFKQLEAFTHDDILFFDVEVFPNLFIICWAGMTGDPVKMINPRPDMVRALFDYKLVGFNNIKYDNIMLECAACPGVTNLDIYDTSVAVINGGRVGYSQAKARSYTDIFDFASTKQSLKKWEIEMAKAGRVIMHQELGLDWNKDVPEDLWDKVASYCCNDVLATRELWSYIQPDFVAREILADISGGVVNNTTNTLTTKLIFGDDKNPELYYTDFKTGETFDGNNNVVMIDPTNKWPDYEYIEGYRSENVRPHNTWKGIDLGFGGYVYAKPGMYGRAKTYDVASMHPHSILKLKMFGKYTDQFADLLTTRILIKHKEFDKAGELFGGKLKRYLTDPEMAKALSKALKIAINSVYGLTSASFKNPFKDDRNYNNIVALRGALFMASLKEKVEEMGYTVIHIKTDSIKIADPDDKIEQFVFDYGHEYGYSFEIEHSFEKLCLVNNAVYIAKLAEDDPDAPGEWEATGTMFQIPYVYKTLFSHKDLEFYDLCVTKEVTTALYLDFNEDLPEESHDMQFIGKVGLFCPMQPGCGAGLLMREGKDKYSYATGAKGYRWMESEVVKANHLEDKIDRGYFDKLVDDALNEIAKYGDPEAFRD